MESTHPYLFHAMTSRIHLAQLPHDLLKEMQNHGEQKKMFVESDNSEILFCPSDFLEIRCGGAKEKRDFQ